MTEEGIAVTTVLLNAQVWSSIRRLISFLSITSLYVDHCRSQLLVSGCRSEYLAPELVIKLLAYRFSLGSYCGSEFMSFSIQTMARVREI